MDNMLSILWEEKSFKDEAIDKDSEVVDYVFKGIRCTPDVAYKIAYLIGSLLELDKVHFLCEDKESTFGAVLEIPNFEKSFAEMNGILQNYDEEDNSGS